MKKINKIKSIVVIIILVFALIYLLSNRTKNVFEEMYYSECPSVIKGGITNTSLLSIRECYRGNRTLEKDLGQTIYKMELFNNIDATIYIEKTQQIMLQTYIENLYWYLIASFDYDLRERILYINISLKEQDTYEIVQNSEEVLPQFLAEQGIDATTLEEVSDIMLEEFLRQWFEGNSMSKFSMDDLGDFEIVYE